MSVLKDLMSDEFDKAAAEAVQKAIEKADALGLPKAYDPAPVLPDAPEVVRFPLVPSKNNK